MSTVAQVAPHAPDADSIVVLSWGLGADSTAILLRWLHDPTSRGFDLARLVVVVAMTGDEWKRTGRDAATLLPLLAEHRVRLVQVARGQRHVTKAGDGVVVLDDSTAPTVLHVEGAYRLSQEMLDVGTVPQSGGKRICSVHAKGDALDPVIARLAAGRPYRHVVGFEVHETKRAAKDAGYNTTIRTGWYPLREWGWDRAACETYIHEATGIHWTKSACVFCPFALSTKAGRAATIRRMAHEEPAGGLRALMMERTSLALNPRQGLIAGRRLVDAVREHGERELLDMFGTVVVRARHALYEVRRIVGGPPDRSVRVWSDGTLDGMLTALAGVAADAGLTVEVGEDGISRVWVRRRDEHIRLSGEHFYVVAPATARDKQKPGFEDRWARLPEPELTLL